MGKIIGGLTLVVLAFCLFLDTCRAQNTLTLNDLIEKGREFDGTSVTVQGEAIGEALERGDFAWVNINDGTTAMGIWMKITDAMKINVYGDYKHKGDNILVSGTFYRACKEHGGDMDIHASVVEVAEPGHMIKQEVSAVKIISGGALTIMALAAGWAYLIIRKHPKMEAKNY